MVCTRRCLRVVAHEVRAVVVHDGFALLYVALTRTIDNGPSIFEHGEEVGIYKRLSEHILCGAVEIRSLPLPTAVAEIAPMARPNHQVSVG